MQSSTTAVALANKMNTPIIGANENPSTGDGRGRHRSAGGEGNKGRASVLLSALALIFTLPALAAAQSDLPQGSNTSRGQAQAQRVEFNIASQPMETALTTLGAQSGFTIIVETKVSKGIKAAALTGTYTTDEALKKLLEPAKLKAEYLDSKTIAIRSTDEQAATTRTELQKTSLMMLAQNTGNTGEARNTGTEGAKSAESTNEQNPPQPSDTKDESKLEEVVVTGTHIRGVSDRPSPVMVYERADIERTGVSTIQDFFSKIPQNFGGGANPGNTLQDPAVGRDATSLSTGASINLRGLGAGKTLTLINGQRLASSEAVAFADVSMIPLTAIDRIEVLTDGASAIYGSDAVGGVVNIVLREKLDGLETGLRGGAVTTGGLDEWRLDQSGGISWNQGNAMVMFEHQKQGNLAASDKPFSRGAPLQPYDLISAFKRDSLFALGRQTLTDNVSLAAQAYYSHRRTTNLFTFDGSPAVPSETDVHLYGGSAQLRAQLPRNWQARLDGGVSYQTAQLRSTRDEGKTSAVSLTADGPVVAISGGEIRVALGAEYRREHFQEAPTEASRSDRSAFVEAQVPIVDSSSGVAGVRRLELNAAVRNDDYSDFGSTTNPKFGLLWQPFSGLTLRTTYGRSFRAPNLNDLSPLSSSAIIAALDDPVSATGKSVALILLGGNPTLGPERATITTAGFEIHPAIAQLSVKANYYEVRYQRRVDQATGNIPGVLSMRNELAPIITDNPAGLQVEDFVSQTRGGFGLIVFNDGPFAVPVGTGPADVQVVADLRLTNIASSTQRGIDFEVSTELPAGDGAIQLSLSGDYILDNARRITAAAPPVNILNEIYNPVDLRLRGLAGVTHGDWNAAIYLNYVASYHDNVSVPRRDIASWTTFDGSLAYSFGDGASYLRNLKATFSIQNIFDRDPPFVVNLPGTGFDPTNANPLGRFVALDLSVEW